MKPLLILDVDETLIHATLQPYTHPADFTVFKYAVYKRPYLTEFLTHCAIYFELAIWSSASDDYVQAIVQEIMPTTISLAFCWGRSRCTPKFLSSMEEFGCYRDVFSSHYDYTKQLYKVRRKGYPSQKTLIVDDTPSKVANSYGNAIYIEPFEGNPADEELLYLQKYLLTIYQEENYRSIEKRFWRKEIV
jgi:RNA polymerase II subunit A small phosphatase-like protein